MHRLRYQDSLLTQTVRSGQGRNFASSHGEPEGPGHTLRIIEILGGLMEIKSPFSEHLDRAGTAHPTASQGFRLLARVDFMLIQ